jgi:hypothetical protein
MGRHHPGRLTRHRPSACSRPRWPLESITSTRPSTTALASYYGPGVVNDLIREALYPYPDGLAIVSKIAVRRDDSGAVLPFGIAPLEAREHDPPGTRVFAADRAILGRGSPCPAGLLDG